MNERRHIHLVGTVNLPTAGEVLDKAGAIMGNDLLRLPDGEPGPRRAWVMYQRPMFVNTPYFISSPDDLGGNRMLRPGVCAQDITFPELGYAREARLSYSDFKAAKRAGKVPEHVRFQVSLPTPLVCLSVGLVPDSIPAVEEAYTDAMLREISVICDAIPHNELAIQWDMCLEMLMFDGRLPTANWDPEKDPDRIRRITSGVPADVHCGMHLCYGDSDGKHAIEPLDTQKMVELANLITDVAARPLQWIHMPVPIARDDDAFFAPLQNLKLHPQTELFLGLIHHGDGPEGARRRIAAAEKYVSNFGVATECGIGRMLTGEQIVSLFHTHVAACG
jgi:methionine synthase II (cobalamin-independent)